MPINHTDVRSLAGRRGYVLHAQRPGAYTSVGYSLIDPVGNWIVYPAGAQAQVGAELDDIYGFLTAPQVN